MNARHQEVINRIEYMYKDVDGNINFPNSFDGDVLKIAYKSAKASLVHLNDNQKIVFEWLKWSVKDQRHSTIDAVFLLKSGEALDSVLLTLMELNDPQQAEVLAAFAQWALEQEEEK